MAVSWTKGLCNFVSWTQSRYKSGWVLLSHVELQSFTTTLPETTPKRNVFWKFDVWQSIRPASFLPAGLTLWPNRLECWLATLSWLSTQVRIPVGLSVPGRYIGGSSTGLGKAQHIYSSLRADWLSCFSLAWWEWQVVWCHWGKKECENPAGLLASRQLVWPFGRIS